jgi:hypothetical protein
MDSIQTPAYNVPLPYLFDKHNVSLKQRGYEVSINYRRYMQRDDDRL